jgi:hypothetical protein
MSVPTFQASRNNRKEIFWDERLVNLKPQCYCPYSSGEYDKNIPYQEELELPWTSNLNAAAGAIGLVVMCAATIPGAAQEANGVASGPVQAVTGSAQRISLKMGEAGLFQTSAPFAKISVTDEKIVEVMPQSDRELLLNPRAVGSTNVFVFDDKSGLVARLDVSVDVSHKIYSKEPDVVRVYGRIYNGQGGLNRPATYHCDHRDCEYISESANTAVVPTEAATPEPKPGEVPDKLNAP